MQNKTQLVLISAQAVPNITPILDKRFKPQQVIMLVSDDMMQRSEYLEKIYKPRGIKVSRWKIKDPWDVEHIRQRIEDLLIENDFFHIVLNATGGTKPMSIAAYEVFRENNLDIFYIHPELDRLIWMHPKRPAIDLADSIKLKEYLYAYGASDVNEVHKAGVVASLRTLFKELIDNITKYEPALSSLNWYAASAHNPHLRSKATDDKNGDHVFWDLVDLFERANLLSKLDGRLVFPDEDSRFMVNGGWLELYTYQCCLGLKKKLGIQDVARSVEIARKNGKNTVLNEMDVALLKDNRLYLLECKTKQFIGNSKKHSECDDVLYKLDSIRDVIGGLQAKAMLVSLKKLEKHHLNRAKELNVQLCCNQDIKFMEDKIENWLNN